MRMSLIEWVFLLAGILLHSLILIVMFRRNLRRSYPAFFTYTAFALFLTCILAIAARVMQEAQYFYLYWLLYAVGLGLSIYVLQEAFSNLLKPYSAVVDLGRLLFWWAALFLVFASVLTAAFTNGTRPDKLTAAICLAQRSIQLMQCGMLLLLLVFERRLGLSWRSHGMCIATGIGIYAASTMVISHLQNSLPSWQGSLGVIANFVSVAVLLLWTVGLALPEPSRASAQDSPQRLILQRWNEALLISPLSSSDKNPALATVDSFLPGIEKTVDRVLARKIAN